MAGVAALWGVFWIPVRALDAGGLGPTWSTFLYFTLATLAFTPIAYLRRRRFVAAGSDQWLSGLVLGSAFVLYFVSLAWTEVARSLLLFYMTPVWATVMARVLLRERFTAARFSSLALGLTGLLVILGLEGGLPTPRNAGDWAALLSGFLFAYGTLRLYRSPSVAPFESVYTYLVGGSAAAFVLLLLTLRSEPAPSFAPSIVAVLLITIALTLPTMFVMLWGAGRLPPARVGLLLMAEAVAGIATAAIWAGEPFGLREALGTLLILGAGAVEVLARPPPSRLS